MFSCTRTPGYIYSVPLAGAPQGAATDAGAFELAGHQRPVTALAPLRCCRRLASAAEDGSVKVWGLGSRQALQTMHAAKGAAVTALLLVPKARERERCERCWTPNPFA